MNERNGEIEFLRIIFCMTVLIFHGKEVMADGKIRIMFSGRLGVEFFFIVSGYLMAVSLEKAIRNNREDIVAVSESFIFKKFKSVYPAVVIAFFEHLIISFLVEGTSFLSNLKKLLQGTSNLFLIQMTGVQFYTINGTWYISSMLLCMAILFPLMMKYYYFMRRLGVGLIALIFLGFLMQNTKSLGSPTDFIGDVVYKGNIRAMAEISLGALVYEGTKFLSRMQLKFFGKMCITFLEVFSYGVSLIYMVAHKGSKYDYYIVFLLAVGILISFSRTDLFNSFFDKPFFYFCGKASFYLYLAHLSVARDYTFLLGSQATNKERMIVYILLAILSSVVLWALCIAWKHLWKVMSFCLLKREE